MAEAVADPAELFMTVQSIAKRSEPFAFEHWWHSERRPIDIGRLVITLAQRQRNPQDQSLLPMQLQDAYLPVRRAAVQWIGEEKLSGFRPHVEALLADPATTPDLFRACLATLQLLDGKPASEFEQNPPTQYIAAMVKDAARPAALRATALRMLPPNAPELDAALLTELLSSNDETLRTEAARTLAGSQLPEARELLLKVAANPQASIEIRAEALGGLCAGPHEEPLPGEVEALLLQLAQGDNETLQLEALRSLRGRAVEGSRIRKEIETVREAASDDMALREALDVVLNGKSHWDEEPRLPTAALDGGDTLAGRRVFFHHNGPLCAKCHTVQGRGGQVGPDLTVIARTMDREKLLASILEPSKEIAPQFTTWVIETTAGKTHTGFILEDNRTGQIKLGTPTGEVLVIDENDIVAREPSKTSVMPEKLHQQMTPQELRDLLAFLETQK
jgi:putative heme-binding domain-containing protein